MYQTRHALLLGCVVLVVAAARGDADSDPVITGLSEDLLFSELQLTRAVGPRTWGLGPYGVWYRLEAPGAESQAWTITLAVHSSTALANAALERFQLTMSVAPSRNVAQGWSTVGDRRLVWGDRDRGTLAFSRDNVTVIFEWYDAAQGLLLASRLDQLLRADRRIAPRGSFQPAPEVVSTGLPERVLRGSTKRVTPELRGLGKPTQIIVRAVALGSTETWCGGEQVRLSEDGKVSLTGPKSQLPGPVPLLFVAANDENVFVAKQFTIELTE